VGGRCKPWILVLFLAITTPVCAHVVIDSPNGGEVVEAGDTITVSWHITIAHNLLNWDLWYSTVGSSGPWVEIAMDLPAGSPAVGSDHTYDWTVPVDAASPAVWIRVRMDNSGTDYFDVTNGPLSVGLPGPFFVRGDSNGDEMVDIADPIGALDYLFASGNLSCFEAADANDDGAIDVADPIYLLAWLFTIGSPAPPAPFPDCESDPLPETVGCGVSACSP
jgi:hypothetical protein